MTDKDLAQLQLAIYDGNAASSLEWDNYQDGPVVWASKVIDGITAIILRGSVTFEDWMRDFRAWADPIDGGIGILGPIHPGFYDGMVSAWSQICANTKAPRVIAGHSLGAGRAAILTGLMVKSGAPPLARVVWGEPKSGFAKLAEIISGVPTRSYRNSTGFEHDLVTDVPLTIPPEDYVHASPLTDIHVTPSDDIRARLGPFAWHHMSLYAAGTPATVIA